MQPTQTGIATALALAVVGFFYFFNGMSLFQSPAAAVESQPAQQITTSTTTPTMPPAQNATELQVKDEVVGTGATAAPGDTVTVNYVGSLVNGTVFDASANHGSSGFTFTLGTGQVIQGWDKGIAGMKVGGKRLLVIPPAMAYGDRAVGNVIPANSTLVFEVQLLSVQKAH